MSTSEDVETNNVLLDEERRQASHQEVKSSIDDDVNARIKRESARVEPKESGDVAEVAHELKQKAVREAVGTERELGRGRAAARISQVVDYCFYIIYGLIALVIIYLKRETVEGYTRGDANPHRVLGMGKADVVRLGRPHQRRCIDHCGVRGSLFQVGK